MKDSIDDYTLRISLLGTFLGITIVIEIAILIHVTILLVRSKKMIETDKKRKDFII